MRYIYIFSVFFKGMRTNDYVLIVRAISVITGVLPFFFIYCKVGEDVTEAFGTIDEAIYMTSWYICPIHTQNYLKLLMMMAQKEVDLKGFATFNCSCDTFKRVTQITEGVNSVDY